MSEDRALPELAGYLAQYWRHAGKVRSRHLSHYQIVPPIVNELENYAWWQKGETSVDFRLNNGLALYQVISRNREEIRRIAEQARQTDEAEDIQHFLDTARELQREIETANALLELING